MNTGANPGARAGAAAPNAGGGDPNPNVGGAAAIFVFDPGGATQNQIPDSNAPTKTAIKFNEADKPGGKSPGSSDHNDKKGQVQAPT